jgi:hypothetical protein
MSGDQTAQALYFEMLSLEVLDSILFTLLFRGKGEMCMSVCACTCTSLCMKMHKFVHVHAPFNFIIFRNSLGFYIIFSYVGINTCRNNFFP